MFLKDFSTGRNSFANRRQWRQPRLIAIHYPTTITRIRDLHNWIAAMMLDRRLKERTRLILSRLALHLNLKTGRLDPSVGTLATEVALRGPLDVVERMVRRALTEAAKVGWIARTRRHGGNAKTQNQTNSYELTIPNDITTGPWSPVEPTDDRTKPHERPDSEAPSDRTQRLETTGLWSQGNSEENSESNNEIRTRDSSWESDEERKGKEAREVQSDFPSNSNPAGSSSSPRPGRSARPLAPQPTPLEESELGAALKRFDAAHLSRSNGGLTSGSSDVMRAQRWRQ